MLMREATVTIWTLVLLNTSGPISGGSNYERADILSEKPNICYKDTYTKSLPRGQVMYVKDCEYTECIMMDGQLFWGYHYCDKVFLPSGCKTEQQTQFAYPLCCPRLKCWTFKNGRLLRHILGAMHKKMQTIFPKVVLLWAYNPVEPISFKVGLSL